jgi:ketosteroid isomerase-like protein
MIRRIATISCVICSLIVTLSCNRASRPNINQDELVHRTQELVDSVAAGDQAPWNKYFADDAMFFDERGENLNKKELVASIVALPLGYSGTIKVANAKSQIQSDVAILSYDLNEIEIVYGQKQTARYHETDTWMQRDGRWQIVAGQVLRYYEDPAPGEADPRAFADYVGTYEAAPEKIMTVSKEGKQLFLQRGDRPKAELILEAGPIFFRKGVEGRIIFRRGAGGKVDELIDRRNNEDVVWKRVK